jgi:hypothetical protein
MKPSPSKALKTAGGKKRAHEEAAGSAAGTPPVSPPRPDPNQEWKKYKAKTEDLLALLNSGFLREKEVDMWRAAAGDPYPMEGACRGRTGRHRQYPRRPSCDGGPIELVSVDPSRVVHWTW